MAGVSLNKILLVGNLTKDPELRYLPNGTPKAELRLATSRTYTTNGERREDTCYVDVIAWSRTAENVNQYLKKGSKIFVEGRLDYQEWEGQDGSKRSKHQVVADRVQFMDTRNGGGGEDGGDFNAAGEGGAPRYQRNASSRPSYAPRSTYAPPVPEAPASVSAPVSPTAVGEAPKPEGEGAKAQFASGELPGAMGITEDDIPF
jgi:single-strand DNA-binding protein